MSCACPYGTVLPPDPGPPPVAGVPPAPAPGETRLVLSRDERQVLTARADCDARTAVVRGLAEYVVSLRGEAGGRPVGLRAAHFVWAAHEEQSIHPAAYCFTDGECSYEPVRFTPGSAARLGAPDGRVVAEVAEMTAPVVVEVWSTDPEDRANLALLLERAMCPSLSWYGLRLVLPHYHGAHASYEVRSLAIDEGDAASMYRRMTIRVSARVPVLRLHSLPSATPRADFADVAAAAAT